MENYRNILNAKEIILYGASSSGSRALNNLLFMKVNPSVIRFYDLNPEKQGRNFLGMPVLSESEFLSRSRDVLIIISSVVRFGNSPFNLLKVSMRTILLFTTIPDKATIAIPVMVVLKGFPAIRRPIKTPTIDINTALNTRTDW